MLVSGWPVPEYFYDKSLEFPRNRADTKSMETELSPTDKFNQLYDAVLASEDNYGNFDAAAQDALANFLDTDEAKGSSSVQAEARMAGF